MPESDAEAWDALDPEVKARMPWLRPEDFTLGHDDVCAGHGCLEAYDALVEAQAEIRAEGGDPHDHGPEYRSLGNWQDGG